MAYAPAGAPVEARCLELMERVRAVESIHRHAACEAVEISDIPVMGIESITEKDLLAARRKGFLIKLVAGLRRVGSRVSLRIGPALVPKSHRLPNVSLARNGLSIGSLFSGELLLNGEGVGRRSDQEMSESSRATVGEAVHFVRISAVGRRLPPSVVTSAFRDAGVGINDVEFRPGQAVVFTRAADERSIQRALCGIPGAGTENILIVPALSVALATPNASVRCDEPRRIVEIESARITA